jgi:nucleoside-diphosphate-sugar epimerase
VRTLLAGGHEVLALVRPRTDLQRLRDVLSRIDRVEADLGSPDLPGRLADGRPEAAVHLAWYAMPGRYLDAVENLESLENSLRLVRALAAVSCRRFVGVGTCLEYALGTAPVSESSPTGPTRLYAAAKLALATVLDVLRGVTGMSTAWARLFYVYGPAEDERRLVPLVLRAVLAGKRAPVSTGDQVRDYLHVDDVAAALAAIALGAADGVVNVASGRAVTVREIVLAASRAAGRPDVVDLGALPRDLREPPYVVADVSRLRDVFGFTPRIGLEEGLSLTAAWWASRTPTGADTTDGGA